MVGEIGEPHQASGEVTGGWGSKDLAFLVSLSLSPPHLLVLQTGTGPGTFPGSSGVKHALFSCIFLNDTGSPHLAFIDRLLSTLSFIGWASSFITFVSAIQAFSLMFCGRLEEVR